jgi:hypothetical protein
MDKLCTQITFYFQPLCEIQQAHIMYAAAESLQQGDCQRLSPSFERGAALSLSKGHAQSTRATYALEVPLFPFTVSIWNPSCGCPFLARSGSSSEYAGAGVGAVSILPFLMLARHCGS